ncbi:Interleukin-1 receptor accessory protein-like 1-B [Collichthys lucidus]|uniref:Interleukin-1 receptor accessory protein-like 1-B n=1 Tax=Collichthys lucidus TaxID=240159 RepID=A0A4U5TYR5_COLLU|nr:Interleukin-1 receptor accessory protein-like 1-B [Collichthys lucidus]
MLYSYQHNKVNISSHEHFFLTADSNPGTLQDHALYADVSALTPLTDKPPKILFPSENKISNMELQLGKSILGFPPAAVSAICVILQNDRKPSPTHLQAPSTD